MEIKTNKALLKSRQQNKQVTLKPSTYEWISQQSWVNKVSRDSVISELIKHWKKTQQKKKESK